MRAYKPLHEEVDRVHHACGAAEIVVHAHDLHAGTLRHLFAENERVAQAEAIDALLHVAHKEPPAPGGQAGKHRFLNGIGVLVLVHEHMRIPGVVGGRDVRPRKRGIGKRQHVVIVDDAPLPLNGRIVRSKAGKHPRDLPAGLAQIGDLPPDVLPRCGGGLTLQSLQLCARLLLILLQARLALALRDFAGNCRNLRAPERRLIGRFVRRVQRLQPLGQCQILRVLLPLHLGEILPLPQPDAGRKRVAKPP